MLYRLFSLLHNRCFYNIYPLRSKNMRYLLIIVLVLSVVVQADWSATSNLDKPYTGNRGSEFLKISTVGSFFNACNIYEVIGFITGRDNSASTYSKIGIHENWGWKVTATLGKSSYFDGVTQEGKDLKNRLLKYYNQNTASAEVFTNLINTNSGIISTFGNLPQDDYFANTIREIDETKERRVVDLYLGRNTTVEGEWSYSKDILDLTFGSGERYRIHAYADTTPIVLDLDGDGKLEASNGEWLPHKYNQDHSKLVNFDINGDGFDELVEWVGPNDGLLITYTPGEEVSGKNLFGNALGFTDGFERLKSFDTNNDLKLTGEELANIKEWRDANQNAKVDAGEILSLEELGITELCVLHSDMKSYFIQNGKRQVMWDWHPNFFMVKKTK